MQSKGNLDSETESSGWWLDFFLLHTTTHQILGMANKMLTESWEASHFRDAYSATKPQSVRLQPQPYFFLVYSIALVFRVSPHDSTFLWYLQIQIVLLRLAHLLFCFIYYYLPTPSRPSLIMADWEEHRDELNDLYIVKNETLKNIMKIMVEKYDFKAS